jgi:hypothetical protein
MARFGRTSSSMSLSDSWNPTSIDTTLLTDPNAGRWSPPEGMQVPPQFAFLYPTAAAASAAVATPAATAAMPPVAQPPAQTGVPDAAAVAPPATAAILPVVQPPAQTGVPDAAAVTDEKARNAGTSVEVRKFCHLM